MTFFTYTHLTAPDSSFIDKVAFNNETGTLAVQFSSGSWVVYLDWTELDYSTFVESDSVGVYYNKTIRGKINSFDNGHSPLDFVEAEHVSKTEKALSDLVAAEPVWYNDGPAATGTALRRYSVAYEFDGGVRGGNTQVTALNEELALIEFNRQIEMATPFMGKDYFEGLRVRSITRYFD